MNLFVSLHGVAHNVFKVSEKEYFTKVPKGMKVYMFAPTNHCVYSNESSEHMMKWMLKNPNWTCSPECGVGGIFEHTQLYLPGNTITNLMLDGDEPQHYGVYNLDDSMTKKLPMVFDTAKQETTYDVERLLATLAPKTNKTINVFLCICSPHTISPHHGSVLKWSGKIMPSRKATRKYDSFQICQDTFAKIVAIQEKRMLVDIQGKQRFQNHAIRRMFTRSMNFPLKLRNGSIDHIPPTIGRGVGEENVPLNQKGIYYKIDNQDEKTNILYEHKKRQMKA